MGQIIAYCGLLGEIENCAQCGKYPCNKLDKPFENSPQNKILLDGIGNGIGDKAI